MSSTPASSSVAAPSSRVQSANNKINGESSQESNKGTTSAEKLSRPPSAQKTAADTSRASVVAATGAGISPGAPASGSEENISSTFTSNERPSSANKQPALTSTIGSRSGSAAKDPSQNISSRPASALKGDSTLTSSLDATNGTPTTARLSSASRKQDETMTTGSRPSSANKKSEDTASNNSTNAVIGLRLSSAGGKQDETANTAPTNSRPSSANKQPEDTSTNCSINTVIGLRPPSANRKQVETTANKPTTGEQDISSPSDPNDPNITQPTIGGGPSATGKKESNKGPTTIAALAIAIPLNSLVVDTPASNNNNPVTAGTVLSPISSRSGSASNNSQARTTTESNT